MKARAEAAHRGSHCETEPGRTERKKQRLSSEMLKRKRTKGSRREAENPEGQSVREAPEEQLWEANQGRAKGNEQKAEYAEPEGSGRETSRGRRRKAKGT